MCPNFVQAQSPDDKAIQLKNQITDLENKITSLENQKTTLSKQISIIDSQISLAQLRINQSENDIVALENEIQKLAVEIGKLDVNLNQLTTIFIQQINQNYRLQKQGPPIAFIIFNNFNNFLQQRKYTTTLQKNSQETILAMETTRTNFDIQKTQKEQKQTELEAMRQKLADQKKTLDYQKNSKKKLLEETKNSEANYQKQLAETTAEYNAINNILAGKGDESFVKNVKKGDAIATVIEGRSCNSTGTHLHFTVAKDGTVQNPFNFLKPTSSINDSEGDSFNPSGSWDWPLKPTIELNQGYGNTWAVRARRVGYNFHSGIDISSSSNEVMAVADGKLYRGSYTGQGSCRLRYVRIESDNKIETYYLHVNYY